MLFFVVEVADAGAVVDAGRTIDGAGFEEQVSASVVLPDEPVHRRPCCGCCRPNVSHASIPLDA